MGAWLHWFYKKFGDRMRGHMAETQSSRSRSQNVFSFFYSLLSTRSGGFVQLHVNQHPLRCQSSGPCVAIDAASQRKLRHGYGHEVLCHCSPNPESKPGQWRDACGVSPATAAQTRRVDRTAVGRSLRRCPACSRPLEAGEDSVICRTWSLQ